MDAVHAESTMDTAGDSATDGGGVSAEASEEHGAAKRGGAGGHGPATSEVSEGEKTERSSRTHATTFDAISRSFLGGVRGRSNQEDAVRLDPSIRFCSMKRTHQ